MMKWAILYVAVILLFLSGCAYPYTKERIAKDAGYVALCIIPFYCEIDLLVRTAIGVKKDIDVKQMWKEIDEEAALLEGDLHP